MTEVRPPTSTYVYLSYLFVCVCVYYAMNYVIEFYFFCLGIRYLKIQSRYKGEFRLRATAKS
jgi:hypothetical protein